MFDFNWYRLSGSSEDWRIRAERLRTEIKVNKYWYGVITISIPRYSSSEDAERVSMLLNQRMRLNRQMERELEWLDEALGASADATAEAARRKKAWADNSNPYLRYILLADAGALLAVGPFRRELEEFSAGIFLIILAIIVLGVSASYLVTETARAIMEMIEARKLMRVAKQLPESDLVPFVRAVRLRDYQRTGGYTGVDAT